MATNIFRNYIVIDRESEHILLAAEGYETANFVGASILNTRVSRLSEDGLAKVKSLTSGIAKGVAVFSRDGAHGFTYWDRMTPMSRVRQERAELYAEGYRYLLFHVRGIVVQYDHACSLEVDDLPLYTQSPGPYIALYAHVHGIPDEDARSQLNFDHANILSLQLRKKELLWEHGKSLRTVKNRAELDAWKVIVRDNVIGIGMV